MKYYTSNNIPFWNRGNKNRPSPKLFKQWVANYMVEATNLQINFSSLVRGTLNSSDDGIKYVKVTNNGKDYFYYVDSVNTVNTNGKYVYNIALDWYATATVNFIKLNEHDSFIFLRRHEYSKEALEFDDEEIESIPKFYKDIYFSRKLFNKDEKTGYWYGEHIGIKSDKPQNANKYYVFSNGSNGGYRFYPILASTSTTSIISTVPKKWYKTYSSTFSNNVFNKFGTTETIRDIPAEVTNKVNEAYGNGDIVVYSYHSVEWGYRFPAYTVWLSSDWKNIEVPYGTLPQDLAASSSIYNTSAAVHGGKTVLTVLGNEFYNYEGGGITSSKFGDNEETFKNVGTFQVEIFKADKQVKTQVVNNSIAGLEEMRAREEYSNKFIGKYYLPHFLNFDSYQLDGDKAYIEINPSGQELKLYSIYDYNISNVQDAYNNDTYSTPYLLKYLDVKYYGHSLKAEYRTNEMFKIFIGGLLLFSDCCSLISKSDEKISLEDSVISFPYQLPVGSNEYRNYVNANRGVTDTGYGIMKQQESIAVNRAVFGGIYSGIKGFSGGVAQAALGAASGDVGDVAAGITGAAFSTYDAIGKTVNGVVDARNNTKWKTEQIRAQYEKARNTTGNKILASNMKDAANMLYYDSDSLQFEGVEVKELRPETLAQINNYIFLNGYFIPEKSDFNTRINNSRKFNYIQIDGTLLMECLNISNFDERLPNQVYDEIFSELTTGIRIWNDEPLGLSVMPPMNLWPARPERPVLPPLPAPVETTDEYNLIIEDADMYWPSNKSINHWFVLNSDKITTKTGVDKVPLKMSFPADVKVLRVNFSWVNLNKLKNYENTYANYLISEPETDEGLSLKNCTIYIDNVKQEILDYCAKWFGQAIQLKPENNNTYFLNGEPYEFKPR